jgi:hypothetical protein
MGPGTGGQIFVSGGRNGGPEERGTRVQRGEKERMEGDGKEEEEKRSGGAELYSRDLPALYGSCRFITALTTALHLFLS